MQAKYVWKGGWEELYFLGGLDFLQYLGDFVCVVLILGDVNGYAGVLWCILVVFCWSTARRGAHREVDGFRF